VQPPAVTADYVRLALDDPDGLYERVVLFQQLQRPRFGPSFERTRTGWSLRLPRPAVDRMEYLLQLVLHDGTERLIVDPKNPKVAAGPFGDKSVIEWPEYRPPRWLRPPPDTAGSMTEQTIVPHWSSKPIDLQLWSSCGTHDFDSLPLLLVHDGSDYNEYSSLTMFLEAKCASGELPPMRAALLAPTDRDHTYSASATYARTLAHEVLPWLHHHAPSPGGCGAPVALGASLGALALLHAHRTHPPAFGSLFLQSGSFFRQRYDRQESEFVRFRRITRFMDQVLSAREWPTTIPVTITCATVEENRTNNIALADALRAQGYGVSFAEHRDAHNWISWRDTFEPHLLNHLQRAWT
jgi:enterochelin esterase-like enzyme